VPVFDEIVAPAGHGYTSAHHHLSVEATRFEIALLDDELKTFALLDHAVDSFSGMGTDKRKLNLDAAAAFLETVPRGCWTSYGDVAVAAGRGSNAAQGVVSWIGSNGHRVANVHRVLNVNGEVNPGWTPAGPGLPANASEVTELLQREGVRFINSRANPSQRWRSTGR
jgi:alkylated DNA nucleotide flippase Atl1